LLVESGSIVGTPDHHDGVLCKEIEMKKQDVIDLLTRLLDQAKDVEATTDHIPTAVEALEWAISEVNLFVEVDVGE
jgi:hypothetical protein